MSRTDLDLFADGERVNSRVRSVEGEGMVEPVREFTVNGERLRPGRSRLSPEHPWVRAMPELFRPAMRGDRATAARMRSLYRAAERALTRERIEPSGGNGQGGLKLPDPSPRPLRLP
jgi:hypothetical protein